MPSIRKNQRLPFALLITVIGIILLMRLWPLYLLYLDPSVRNRLLADVEKVSAEQGWLLSDVSVVSITRASATLIYQPHTRVGIAPTCYTLDLAASSLHPCAKS